MASNPAPTGQDPEQTVVRRKGLGQRPLQHDRTSAATCSARATCRPRRSGRRLFSGPPARPRSRSTPFGRLQRGGVHGEAGLAPPEKRHVQPGEPTQLGGGSIVDAESGAEPGDRIGASTGTIVSRTSPPSSGTTQVGPASARPPRAAGQRERRAAMRRLPVSGVIAPSSETSMSTSRRSGADGSPAPTGVVSVGVRHRGLQREVAREQAQWRRRAAGCGRELPARKGAGQPKLLADLVAGGRAHEARDDKQADGEHDREEPDEDDDQATAEAPEAQRFTSPVPRYARRARGSSSRPGPVGGSASRAAI